MNTDHTPTTTDEVRAAYFVSKTGLRVSAMSHYPEFDLWLSELIRKEREEAWDEAYREVRGIPHWWNTEDQYGEFDLQPLGPDQTSERGAFMEVRKVLAVNPYRKEQP